MTIDEIGAAYGISLAQLKGLEEQHLFDTLSLVNGKRRVGEQELPHVCNLMKLAKLGMDTQALCAYQKETLEDTSIQVRSRLLKRLRCHLLDQLHELQRDIDCLDYLLHELTQSKHTRK